MRRDGARTALVVANLGADSLRGIRLRSDAGALVPGKYGARDLLGTSTLAEFRVSAGGALTDVSLPTLAPRAGLVFDLTRQRGPQR